jgi:hypothetical protein
MGPKVSKTRAEPESKTGEASLERADNKRGKKNKIKKLKGQFIVFTLGLGGSGKSTFGM